MDKYHSNWYISMSIILKLLENNNKKINEYQKVGCTVEVGTGYGEYKSYTVTLENDSYHDSILLLKQANPHLVLDDPTINGYTMKFFTNGFNSKQFDDNILASAFTLSNCDMTDGTVFIDNSRDSRFINCILNGARFVGSTIGRRSQFYNCKMEKSQFIYCKMGHGYDPIRFTDCNMKGTEMELNKDSLDGCVSKVTFTRCNMTDMDMSKCEFDNLTLEVKSCRTKRLNVDGLVVRDLKSDIDFRSSFMMNGGKIINMSTLETVIMGMYNDPLGIFHP
jgi:hypothetical protein